MLGDTMLFSHSSRVAICFLSIYKVSGAVPGKLCKSSHMSLTITLRLNNLPKTPLLGGDKARTQKILLPKGHKQPWEGDGCGWFSHFHNQRHPPSDFLDRAWTIGGTLRTSRELGGRSSGWL